MKLLLLALAGGLGTLLRYGLSLVDATRVLGERGAWFPLGTLLANIAGSTLLAVVFVSAKDRLVPGTDVPLSLVLGTGVMGGFTTYSTFNLESLRLLEGGHTGRALMYVVVTLASCALGGWLGLSLARGAGS